MNLQLITLTSDLSQNGSQCPMHKVPAHHVCLTPACVDKKTFSLCRFCYKKHPKDHITLPISQIFSKELSESIKQSIDSESLRTEQFVQSKLKILDNLDEVIEKIKLDLNSIQENLRNRAKQLVLENSNLELLLDLKSILDLITSKYLGSQMKMDQYIEDYIPIHQVYENYEKSQSQECRTNLDKVFEAILNHTEKLQRTKNELLTEFSKIHTLRLASWGGITLKNIKRLPSIRRVKTSHTGVIRKTCLLDSDTKAATISSDGDVRIWDMTNCKQLKLLRGHTPSIFDDYDALQLNNGQLVSRSKFEIIIWNYLTGNICSTIKARHWLDSVSEYAPNTLVVGQAQGVTFWNLTSSEGETPLMLKSFNQEGRCFAIVRIARDNEKGLACGSDTKINIYSNPLKDESQKSVLSGHASNVHSLIYSAKQNILISGAQDKSPDIKVWSLDTLENVMTLTGHSKTVISLFLTEHGCLVSSSWDNSVKIWKLHDGECIRTIEGESGIMVVMRNGTLVTCGNRRSMNFLSIAH